MLNLLYGPFSHLYMTTGKTIAFTRQTFVGKVISLLFNMFSTFIIAFLSRSIDFFFFNSCQQGGPKIVEE